MAWLTRTTWATSDPVSATDLNNIGLDLRTWGGDVDAGGFDLANLGDLLVTGSIGAGTASPLTVLHAAGASTVPSGELGSLLVTGGGPQFRLALGYDSSLDYGWIQSVHNGVQPTPLILNRSGGNVGIGTLDFGSGAGVLAIHNALSAPISNPTAGHVVYSQAGALKGRGSSGTVTTIAAAEPHCPECGSDFAVEWQSARYGHLIICMKCLAGELGERPWIHRKTA